MLALAPVPLGVELIIKYLRCQLKRVGVNSRGKIRIKMLTDEKLCKVFHAHQSSIACNRPRLFKGRSHLSSKENMFSETGALRDIGFQKNPLVRKTELETNLFWHNSKLLIAFLTPLLLFPLCGGVKSACFPMKRSSACYHKCHCVLTLTAGGCSGEGVNDQPAAAPITVQMDALNPQVSVQSTMSQHFPAEGGWQEAGTAEGKCSGVERLHGA